MSHLPALMSDLALILISAGIVTIIFKRLGQPLVLGYIVAGFLSGPHMPYTPTVADTGSVQIWADIGVIFLMFTLGLEFSFKKIVKMGSKPVIAASTVMFCMISVGSGVGHLFGWSSMDSLFLGGMLAMSSTTIIYKAFDDLGLRRQKFTGEVLSVLILEDILGILLMVVLSAMAVSRHFEGLALAGSLLKLGFFLILWFIVGVYVVPTFLRRSAKWLNRETLLIVSVGLCFVLVVTAAHAGYSSAFGAFMMGSILAETVEAENIERIVAPVKDLFGAIFFVSVGMLVNPAVLVEYWFPICIITLAILLGQVLLGTSSFLISGHPLKVAMQCGFSLAQIGEFAFIIASLGISLGVTSSFLYPVVVAVSIITTFLTPYMIRAAVPAYGKLSLLIPATVRQRLDGRGRLEARPSADTKLWHSLLRDLISQVAAYATLSGAAIIIALSALLPFCRGTMGHWTGNIVCGILTLLVVSPFLRAIVMRKNHSEEWKTLRHCSMANRLGLWLTFGIRYGIATAAVWYVINFLSPLPSPWRLPVHVLAAVLTVALMVISRQVKMVSIRLERTFLQNLRSREVVARKKKSGGPAYAGRLLSHNVHLAQLELPENSDWGGQTLRQLNFGHNDGVMIAAIVRGQHRINIPDGNTRLFPGDRIEAIGDDHSLEKLAERMATEVTPLTPDDLRHHLMLRRIIIDEHSPLCNRTLSESGLRDRYHCMLVGFEAADGTLDFPTANHSILHHDTIWVVGEEGALSMLRNAGKNHKPSV